MRYTYGSFLELELASVPCPKDSVWHCWTHNRAHASFASARAAFRWLVGTLSVQRVWLPAYICEEVPKALEGLAARISYYPVGEELQLSPDALQQTVSGDMFVYVNYFGRPPAKEFLTLLTKRHDLIRVEDRAQAPATFQATPADWLLYSPRKAFGVPDGGVLVSTRPQPCLKTIEIADDVCEEKMTRLRPLLLGLEDPQRKNGQYTAYRQAEASISASPTGISQVTRLMLQRIPLPAVQQRRTENWLFLHEKLSPWALWKKAPEGFAPFSYPVLVDNPVAVKNALAEQGIFCARHWAVLPSPNTFREAHRLSARLLSIPCDQRMGIEDMARLTNAVYAALLHYGSCTMQ